MREDSGQDRVISRKESTDMLKGKRTGFADGQDTGRERRGDAWHLLRWKKGGSISGNGPDCGGSRTAGCRRADWKIVLGEAPG